MGYLEVFLWGKHGRVCASLFLSCLPKILVETVVDVMGPRKKFAPLDFVLVALARETVQRQWASGTLPFCCLSHMFRHHLDVSLSVTKEPLVATQPDPVVFSPAALSHLSLLSLENEEHESLYGVETNFATSSSGERFQQRCNTCTSPGVELCLSWLITRQ